MFNFSHLIRIACKHAHGDPLTVGFAEFMFYTQLLGGENPVRVTLNASGCGSPPIARYN